MSQQPHQPEWGAPPPQPTKRPKAGNIAALGCLGTVVLIVIVIVAVAVSSSGDSKDKKPQSEGAAVMCERFVKKQLKSPGSADFPGPLDDDYAKTKVLSDTKPWKYKVTGVVDSENSFGAKVRTNYVCTVSTKDADTWTLDDIGLTPR